MLRRIGGIIAGIVAGFVAVLLSQMAVNAIYPPPAGLDMFDRAQVAEAFRNFPPGHFASIVLTYLIGGLVGGYVARQIARTRGSLWVPAVVIALTAGFNVFVYPHPVWAQIAGVLAPLIGGWLASRLPGPAVRDDDAAETRDDEA